MSDDVDNIDVDMDADVEVDGDFENDMEGDGGEEELDELFPDASKQTSVSFQQGVRTVKNHFNKFLNRQHQHAPDKHPFTSFEEAPKEYFLSFRSPFGQFATYLIRVAGIAKWRSARVYLSKMKVLITGKVHE